MSLREAAKEPWGLLLGATACGMAWAVGLGALSIPIGIAVWVVKLGLAAFEQQRSNIEAYRPMTRGDNQCLPEVIDDAPRSPRPLDPVGGPPGTVGADAAGTKAAPAVLTAGPAVNNHVSHESGVLFPIAAPITILFLGANPSTTTRLALDREVREIKRRLQGSEQRNAFKIEQEWAVRSTDLQECLLRHSPAVVHFSGHGSSDGQILLEAETSNAVRVSNAALAGLFRILSRDTHIRCVVLNACFSEVQAQAIAAHIDCVIGMTTAVEDSSAIAFAGAFYQALGFGKDVQTAFDFGCNQIDLAGLVQADVPRLLVREGVHARNIRLITARK